MQINTTSLTSDELEILLDVIQTAIVNGTGKLWEVIEKCGYQDCFEPQVAAELKPTDFGRDELGEMLNAIGIRLSSIPPTGFPIPAII